MHDRVKKFFAGLMVAAIAFIGLTVLAAAILPENTQEEISRRKGRSKFAGEQWKRGKMENGLRYPMVDTLISEGHLLGKPSEAILMLLGLPDLNSKVGSQMQWTYWLGTREQYPTRFWLFPNLRINFEPWMLVITFDRGYVKALRVVST